VILDDVPGAKALDEHHNGDDELEHRQHELADAAGAIPYRLFSHHDGQRELHGKERGDQPQWPRGKLGRRVETIQARPTAEEPDRIVETEADDDEQEHQPQAATLQSVCVGFAVRNERRRRRVGIGFSRRHGRSLPHQ